MKQYLPMKPVKRGFEVWVRADAVTGYFSAFDVYVGKPSDGATIVVGLGERVVLQLSESLRGGNYQIFCHYLPPLGHAPHTRPLRLWDDSHQQARHPRDTETDDTAEGGILVVSEGRPCGIYLDGQEASHHALHTCPGRCHTHCIYRERRRTAAGSLYSVLTR